MPAIHPKPDKSYNPNNLSWEEFTDRLRMDFEEYLRKDPVSLNNPDWEKILRVSAKMFLRLKGLPTKLMKEPKGEILEIVDFLVKIGEKVLNEKNEEKETSPTEPWKIKRVLYDQEKMIKDLGLDEEKAQDYFGETPTGFRRRMGKIR